MSVAPLTVGFVGAGRTAHALARACRDAGLPVAAVSGRSPEGVASLLAVAGGACVAATAPEVAAVADLTFLTVTDAAIPQVAAHIGRAFEDGAATRGPAGSQPLRGHTVVHCSGVLGPDVLAPLVALGADVGCCHPLQAFATVDARLRPGVTFALTAELRVADLLSQVSTALGAVPRPVAPGQRAAYHAAAVLASNYVVTLVWQAAQVLASCGWDEEESRDALLPLVGSTLDGVSAYGIAGGLTGPLVRGDLDTVRRHLDALAPYPEALELYRAAGRATLPLLAARNMDDSARVEAFDMLTLSRNGSPDADGFAPGP